MSEFNVKEIKIGDLVPKEFMREKIEDMRSIVGNGTAINALSGGVDSSACTVLGHRALGDRLKTYFIDHGLMRIGEPKHIVSLFKKMGIKVELVDGRTEFFGRLKGQTDPELKRDAITQAFYQDVLGRLVRESGSRFLLHGTNYTDVEETVAGVKRQHNILDQLGIDTQKVYGYKVIEPLVQLRKPAVRKLAKALGLPAEIYQRPPFPGPALAARVIGEVTPERIEVVKKATKIVEDELRVSKAFQYLAILHNDMVTGVRGGKREFGYQIEVRCWESKDAVTAKPTRLMYPKLDRIARRLTREVPGVVSVTYNITPKPPSTIEAI
jgi:GMP synthase (glutamine-hydrolysing)